MLRSTHENGCPTTPHLHSGVVVKKSVFTSFSFMRSNKLFTIIEVVLQPVVQSMYSPGYYLETSKKM